MKDLSQLAYEYGYRSITDMCLKHGVSPQSLMHMRGRKSRLSTVQSMANRLEVKPEDLARTLRYERLRKVLRDEQVGVDELETIFMSLKL